VQFLQEITFLNSVDVPDTCVSALTTYRYLAYRQSWLPLPDVVSHSGDENLAVKTTDSYQEGTYYIDFYGINQLGQWGMVTQTLTVVDRTVESPRFTVEFNETLSAEVGTAFRLKIPLQLNYEEQQTEMSLSGMSPGRLIKAA